MHLNKRHHAAFWASTEWPLFNVVRSLGTSKKNRWNGVFTPLNRKAKGEEKMISDLMKGVRHESLHL
jgi:hypothetical protein